ncbi:H-NS family nucleoid-associated regulatory protein [Cognatilysobacter terrigena]|uniref:H-NS histone family protein n=1 Tax=Cognatilysobacter terrigena TaxID=2488749 RepID=UPI001060FB7B|nr:H-NS histone family protein [Lysobacter terrigena]
MALDLNSMSAKELESLIAQANKRRAVLKKRKPIADVRKRLEQLARAEGYSIGELFGARGASTSSSANSDAAPAKRTRAKRGPSKFAGTKVAPKYRNPDNANETWSGRGKQPRWLQAYTSKGHALDSFLIR